MTCGHCASFHNTVLPVLKEKYIDTGKVRLVFREFPLDERAALASMMARCAGGDKALPLISMLFSKQDEWAAAKNDFLPKLFKFGQQVGMHQAVVRSVPSEREAHQGHHCRSRPRQHQLRRQPDADLLHQRQEDGWRGSVEDFDKTLAPLIKG